MTMRYPQRPSKDKYKSADKVEPTAAEQPQQQPIESAAATTIAVETKDNRSSSPENLSRGFIDCQTNVMTT